MNKSLVWLILPAFLVMSCDEKGDSVSEKQEVKIEEEKFEKAKVEAVSYTHLTLPTNREV